METQIKEKEIKAVSGWLMLFVVIVMVFGGIALMAGGVVLAGGDDAPQNAGFLALVALGVVVMLAGLICGKGLKVIAPNEALVLTLFGKYYGSIKRDGFFFYCAFF